MKYLRISDILIEMENKNRFKQPTVFGFWNITMGNAKWKYSEKLQIFST